MAPAPPAPPGPAGLWPDLDGTTLRTTEAGQVVGGRGTGNTLAWLGISYAQAPVGPLRWRAPRDPLPWTGIREAVRPGAACCQVSMQGAASGSEDCLLLNIWAPAPGGPLQAPPADLPVMVWIHGGGNARYEGGSFDAGLLAAQGGVVVVTLNYRLGIFGWFSHRCLRPADASPEDASGNYGTLDLIAALRWVRANIVAFGGDPARVTVFGESAGGWNVLSLLTSPLAAGLFQRAIVQSGVTTMVSRDQAERFYDEAPAGDADSSGELLASLLQIDAVARDRAEALQILDGWPLARVADYLRSKSLGELIAGYRRLPAVAGRPPASTGVPALIADGFVLPADGLRGAFARGAFHRVPVILGSTRDELGVLLTGFDPGLFCTRVGGSVRIDAPERFALAVEYLSRLFKANGVDSLARHISAHLPGAVYTYRFDWDELQPAPWAGGLHIGATHGIDVPFVFGHLNLGPEYVQIPLIAEKSLPSFAALSRQMIAYWTRFAAFGAPGSGQDGTLAEWTAWQPHAPQSMILDAPGRGGLRMAGLDESRAQILADLMGDPRIGTPADRRRFFADLVQVDFFTALSPEEWPGDLP
jgi:para-nitrobenzyl esterase